MAKKSKKADNAKLAKGAAKIKKAQKEADKKSVKTAPEPVVIPESTRPIEDVVREHVKVLPGHIGVELDESTPIEESLRILDWTMALHDHAGFMIGDVINFGNSKWGEMYKAALNQTGRALSTLKGYAEVARRITPDKRVAALSFSHHREILRLPDEKMDTVLKEVGEQADEAHKRGEKGPTTKDVRYKVQKLTPRKRKTKGKPTSGKGKKKDRPEPPPYEPTAEEEAQLNGGEEAANELNAQLKEGLFKIVARLDNKEKKRWLAMFHPFFMFHKNLEAITGY